MNIENIAIITLIILIFTPKQVFGDFLKGGFKMIPPFLSFLFKALVWISQKLWIVLKKLLEVLLKIAIEIARLLAFLFEKLADLGTRY